MLDTTFGLILVQKQRVTRSHLYLVASRVVARICTCLAWSSVSTVLHPSTSWVYPACARRSPCQRTRVWRPQAGYCWGYIRSYWRIAWFLRYRGWTRRVSAPPKEGTNTCCRCAERTRPCLGLVLRGGVARHHFEHAFLLRLGLDVFCLVWGKEERPVSALALQAVS